MMKLGTLFLLHTLAFTQVAYSNDELDQLSKTEKTSELITGLEQLLKNSKLTDPMDQVQVMSLIHRFSTREIYCFEGNSMNCHSTRYRMLARFLETQHLSSFAFIHFFNLLQTLPRNGILIPHSNLAETSDLASTLFIFNSRQDQLARHPWVWKKLKEISQTLTREVERDWVEEQLAEIKKQGYLWEWKNKSKL